MCLVKLAKTSLGYLVNSICLHLPLPLKKGTDERMTILKYVLPCRKESRSLISGKQFQNQSYLWPAKRKNHIHLLLEWKGETFCLSKARQTPNLS